MSFTELVSFDLEAVEPYDFALSVKKPAGWWWSTPYEVFKHKVLWTALRFDGVILGLKMRCSGNKGRSKVHCQVYSNMPINDEKKNKLEGILERALKVKEDLNEFYEIAKDDEFLDSVVQDLKGMRTVSWPNLFPALILAVSLQMAPIKRSNRMMDLLIEEFGEEIKFENMEIKYWPSPERIENASLEDLKLKAKLGYRAKSLISIAKSLIQGFPSMDELYRMNPDDARKKLLELYGIGDYSADLIMPGMGFPLDVWSAKIFGFLFLGKEPDDPRGAIPELKKIADEKWGTWKGYAFVYILNDLPALSKKVGFNLTAF